MTWSLFTRGRRRGMSRKRKRSDSRGEDEAPGALIDEVLPPEVFLLVLHHVAGELFAVSVAGSVRDPVPDSDAAYRARFAALRALRAAAGVSRRWTAALLPCWRRIHEAMVALFWGAAATHPHRRWQKFSVPKRLLLSPGEVASDAWYRLAVCVGCRRGRALAESVIKLRGVPTYRHDLIWQSKYVVQHVATAEFTVMTGRDLWLKMKDKPLFDYALCYRVVNTLSNKGVFWANATVQHILAATARRQRVEADTAKMLAELRALRGR